MRTDFLVPLDFAQKEIPNATQRVKQESGHSFRGELKEDGTYVWTETLKGE